MARILVIDDSPDIRYILDEILTHSGYLVDCADDGKIGIMRVGENNYDLIITDLVMPNMDGIEVITEIKKRRPDASIIAISGSTTMGTKGAATFLAQEMHVNRVIAKPFNVLEVLATVKELLGE